MGIMQLWNGDVRLDLQGPLSESDHHHNSDPPNGEADELEKVRPTHPSDMGGGLDHSLLCSCLRAVNYPALPRSFEDGACPWDSPSGRNTADERSAALNRYTAV